MPFVVEHNKDGCFVRSSQTTCTHSVVNNSVQVCYVKKALLSYVYIQSKDGPVLFTYARLSRATFKQDEAELDIGSLFH